MPGMYHYYYDPTYLLVIVGALICMAASANVSHTYRKYSSMGTARGLAAQEVAAQMLREAGITDVRIERIAGNLTDHYDPRNKVLRLSDSVYGSSSVAAVGVAAHECGHAIQHKVGYVPIKIRNAIVPVVNLGSKLSWPVIILGLVMGSFGVLRIGILLFALTLAFQVVTLPVEFNASGRALRVLKSRGILYDQELSGARKVLGAAAMTYVTSTISTILQLLRFVLLFGRRSED
ncbi:zinc metallopeptidase [bacterium D16-51]|nr:zinc metallopeptidase [bacterium D16-59]RKI61615.1 zinc metallopeptidase [bacterium D16-51]